jgi:hypothetical protein
MQAATFHVIFYASFQRHEAAVTHRQSLTALTKFVATLEAHLLSVTKTYIGICVGDPV